MSSIHSTSIDDIRAELGRREDDERAERYRPDRDDRDDDYTIELAEERHRKHRWRCKDRRCGALDCPTCYPLTHAQPIEEDP